MIVQMMHEQTQTPLAKRVGGIVVVVERWATVVVVVLGRKRRRRHLGMLLVVGVVIVRMAHRGRHHTSSNFDMTIAVFLYCFMKQPDGNPLCHFMEGQ